MANVIQNSVANLGIKMPSFSLPQVDTYTAILVGMGVLLVLMISLVFYKLFVYKIKILEMEDRGRSSVVARMLSAKTITENGVKKYQLWGEKDENRKPIKLIASSTDNVIPIKTMGGMVYRDLVIMHRDKIGDYRPWKPIVSAEQINLDDFVDENKETGRKSFRAQEFIDWLFPVLKIDNLKMRGWYTLQTKETLNLYKEEGKLLKKYGNMMMLLFIIFAVGVGAYMLL